MDFAKMKRRELQALCGQHGLAARGSNADLAASLAGALSGGASAVEKMVEVVVGKGCLKQPRGSSSGAAKKVTFVLEEKEEAGEALLASAVSGRGRGWKRVEIGGDSADEGVAGEVYADARVTWSRTNTVNLHADSHNNLADAEEDREVVGAAVDRKQKRKTQENAKGIAANAQAGLSHRNMRKSGLSAAADTHRVESRNNPAEAEEEGEVIGEVGHTKRKRKIIGKRNAGETLPVAAVSGRGNRRKRTEERGGDSSAEGAAGEVGADARVTRSKRNALSLSADGGVESRNIPAEAEEEGEVVKEAIDSKRKRMTRGNAEDISADAHAGISCTSTRCSSLSADAVLLCPVVEKKRERKKAGDSKDELGADEKAAEAQGLATAALPVIVESKRSRRKEEDCEPAVQESAKVEVSGRVTRSCSVNAAATFPVVVETKRKWKTEDVHLDR
ncbi:uncharacterized protein LOC133905273 [Phragmites australis]|uniref:uncharacterized protein LOC133905273 n=1 Tax=Phragmites australis TaxID=29695 RepID=UPI002D77B214|nr:uncharacterized protein LOC133905273 [Phragmites australis]